MIGFTVEQRAGDIAGTATRQAVFHDIVCGVDGSRGSRLATHQAIALSGRDGTIRFIAAHHTEGFGLNEVSTLSERRAVDALDQAVWQAESRGVHASRVLRSAAGSALRFDPRRPGTSFSWSGPTAEAGPAASCSAGSSPNSPTAASSRC
jgi:hypothetical protein